MINPLIKEILQANKITDYLAKKGHHPVGSESGGKLKYRCPIHEGDRTPSFMVYLNGNFENYFCYGCLDYNEKIWTSKGFIKIGDVSLGDIVFDINGKRQKILSIVHKESPCVEVELGCFRQGLLLTKDHISIVVERENALKSFRFLFESKKKNKVYFREDLGLRPVYDTPKIVFKQTSDVIVGDYFLYPVFDKKKITKFSNKKCIKPYTRGEKVKRVENLILNEDLAWFYGLYVAEGSASGNRVVNLTLNINERAYAQRIKKIIKKYYNLKVKISARSQRNTLDVNFCSADLVAHLTTYFGRGANNKKLNPEMFYWEEHLQRAFIQGYQDGDGHKKNHSTTSVSYDLSCGIFALAIQCFKYPTFGKIFYPENKHSYNIIYYKNKNRASGFYEKINGRWYYLSPVTKVNNDNNETKKVVDISVSGTETFLTKMGVTHNCKHTYNIIHLYMAMENVTKKVAIRELSKDLNIDFDAHINEAVEYCERNDSIREQFTLEELALAVSRFIYDFIKRVNFEKSLVNKSEKINEIADKAMDDGDIVTLKALYDNLPDKLQSLTREYDSTATT